MIQVFEVLRCTSEGRRFDSQWCHGKFIFTYSFRPHHIPGVGSASNTNDYQEYFLEDYDGRYVKLTTVPHSFADRLDQCFSTAGPWQQLYRAARGSPGICHFNFLRIFMNKYFIVEIF